MLQINEVRKSAEEGQLLITDNKDEEEEQQLGDTMLAAYWAAVNEAG